MLPFNFFSEREKSGLIGIVIDFYTFEPCLRYRSTYVTHTHTHPTHTPYAPSPLSGMAKANSLLDTIVQHPQLFGSTQTLFPPQWAGPGLTKYPSSDSLTSNRNTGKGGVTKIHFYYCENFITANEHCIVVFHVQILIQFQQFYDILKA